MPPRITQSSLRPRVSDRTMVGTFATALLEKRSDRTTSQTLMSRNSRSPLPHRNRSANMPGHPHPRGWMSRNTPSTRTEGLCFLLTSPFIEPAVERNAKKAHQSVGAYVHHDGHGGSNNFFKVRSAMSASD